MQFCTVFIYAETWLQTELNSKVLNYINVSNYRDVQVAWRPTCSALTQLAQINFFLASLI